MIALAKDITKNQPTHPEESNNPKLKEYMDYQRKLNHGQIISQSLEHAKASLGDKMAEDDADKIKDYLKNTFPYSSAFADANQLTTMLRKLINAQNAANNWYQTNSFYNAVLYDSIEHCIKTYNHLLGQASDQAKEYNISQGVEVDFDDWAQLYFHNLDWMIGQKPNYVHFIFKMRNKAIEEALSIEMKGGKTKQEALEIIKDDFEIDSAAIKMILGNPMEPEDQEILYTTRENPIYDYLHEANADMGVADGECLIDHAYSLAHQLKGLNEEQVETLLMEAER